ncbi:hypothetical protein SDC9_168596 [bioreactor metagenome]|uniref:Uncharacterized protein n=1 Tax=bioreactor metagenome TaxID=1076179 RepID=A0A645G2W8_9ZZZZ
MICRKNYQYQNNLLNNFQPKKNFGMSKRIDNMQIQQMDRPEKGTYCGELQKNYCRQPFFTIDEQYQWFCHYNEKSGKETDEKHASFQ